MRAPFSNRFLRTSLVLSALFLTLTVGLVAAQTSDAPSGTETTTATESTAALADTIPAVSALGLLAQIQELPAKVRSSINRIDTLQWIGAFLAILAGLVLQRFLTFLLRHKAMKIAKLTRFDLDEVFVQAITRPLGFLPITLGLIGAGIILGFSLPEADKPTWFGNFVATALILNIGWAAYNLVDVVTHLLRKVAERTDTNLDDQLVPLIHKAMKVFVVLMTVVTLGHYIGGPFKGILAGVGLGGLAFALAAKDTVANLFGYVVIFLDRPFALGDRVKILDVYGNVEDIGLRSVKVRTRVGTLTSIPNAEVANASIENFTARPSRRAEMIVGLTYDTTTDQMADMVERIREILRETDDILDTQCVVGFQDFGGSSLDIRIRLFTGDTSLAGHLAARQAVNLAIMRAVEERGLSFAFPTRTLVFRQDPDGEAVVPGEPPHD